MFPGLVWSSRKRVWRQFKAVKLLRPLWGRVMAVADYCLPAVWRCDGILTAHENTGWCWGRILLIPSSNLHRCWIFLFVFFNIFCHWLCHMAVAHPTSVFFFSLFFQRQLFLFVTPQAFVVSPHYRFSNSPRLPETAVTTLLWGSWRKVPWSPASSVKPSRRLDLSTLILNQWWRLKLMSYWLSCPRGSEAYDAFDPIPCRSSEQSQCHTGKSLDDPTPQSATRLMSSALGGTICIVLCGDVSILTSSLISQYCPYFWYGYQPIPICVVLKLKC